jgi:hypothetical protein
LNSELLGFELLVRKFLDDDEEKEQDVLWVVRYLRKRGKTVRSG